MNRIEEINLYPNAIDNSEIMIQKACESKNSKRDEKLTNFR